MRTMGCVQSTPVNDIEFHEKYEKRKIQKSLTITDGNHVSKKSAEEIIHESEFGTFDDGDSTNESTQIKQLRRRSISLDNIPVLSRLAPKKDPLVKFKEQTSAENYPGLDPKQRSFRRRGSLDNAWLRTGHAPEDEKARLETAPEDPWEDVGSRPRRSKSFNREEVSMSIADMFEKMKVEQQELDNPPVAAAPRQHPLLGNSKFDKFTELEALREERRRKSMHDLKSFHQEFKLDTSKFTHGDIVVKAGLMRKSDGELLKRKPLYPKPSYAEVKVSEQADTVPPLAVTKKNKQNSLDLVDLGSLMDGLDEDDGGLNNGGSKLSSKTSRPRENVVKGSGPAGTGSKVERIASVRRSKDHAEGMDGFVDLDLERTTSENLLEKKGEQQFLVVTSQELKALKKNARSTLLQAIEKAQQAEKEATWADGGDERQISGLKEKSWGRRGTESTGSNIDY